MYTCIDQISWYALKNRIRHLKKKKSRCLTCSSCGSHPLARRMFLNMSFTGILTRTPRYLFSMPYLGQSGPWGGNKRREGYTIQYSLLLILDFVGLFATLNMSAGSEAKGINIMHFGIFVNKTLIHSWWNSKYTYKKPRKGKKHWGSLPQCFFSSCQQDFKLGLLNFVITGTTQIAKYGYFKHMIINMSSRTGPTDS